MSIVFLIGTVGMIVAILPKEDVEAISAFFMPIIVIWDFSFRFFLKKNPNAAIFPYLVLPIPKKALIFYVIFSDLLSIWIYVGWLIYCVVLCYYETLTWWSPIVLLLFMLMSNYLIVLFKVLIGEYAVLTYPICLTIASVLLLTSSLLSPLVAVLIVTLFVFFIIRILFFALKENLYKELNQIAL